MSEERKHIKLMDPEGKMMKIYSGIPTILPKGTYSFSDLIDEDFIISGETENEITYNFLEKRWIPSKGDILYIKREISNEK